jgi:U3 small nucleolar ribonucleoprotein component
MANHFRQTAEQLRQMASVKRPSGVEITAAEREALESAAKTLCRLEQLKHDMIASDPEDEAASDRLCDELMAVLGVHLR